MEEKDKIKYSKYNKPKNIVLEPLCVQSSTVHRGSRCNSSTVAKQVRRAQGKNQLLENKNKNETSKENDAKGFYVEPSIFKDSIIGINSFNCNNAKGAANKLDGSIHNNNTANNRKAKKLHSSNILDSSNAAYITKNISENMILLRNKNNLVNKSIGTESSWNIQKEPLKTQLGSFLEITENAATHMWQSNDALRQRGAPKVVADVYVNTRVMVDFERECGKIIAPLINRIIKESVSEYVSEVEEHARQILRDKYAYIERGAVDRITCEKQRLQANTCYLKLMQKKTIAYRIVTDIRFKLKHERIFAVQQVSSVMKNFIPTPSANMQHMPTESPKRSTNIMAVYDNTDSILKALIHQAHEKIYTR